MIAMKQPKNVVEAAKALKEDGMTYFEQRMAKRLRKLAAVRLAETKNEADGLDLEIIPIDWDDEEDTQVRHPTPLPVRASNHDAQGEPSRFPLKDETVLVVALGV